MSDEVNKPDYDKNKVKIRGWWFCVDPVTKLVIYWGGYQLNELQVSRLVVAAGLAKV